MSANSMKFIVHFDIKASRKIFFCAALLASSCNSGEDDRFSGSGIFKLRQDAGTSDTKSKSDDATAGQPTTSIDNAAADGAAKKSDSTTVTDNKSDSTTIITINESGPEQSAPTQMATPQESAKTPATPKAPPTADPAKAADLMKKLCAEKPNIVFTQNLVFPSTNECLWNKNGNLDKKDGSLQARESQTLLVDMPEKAVVCSMDLDSKTSLFRYDDNMLITLEEFVLVSSNDLITAKLPKAGDTYFWRWDSVKGMPLDLSNPRRFCLAGTADGCQLPPTDQSGKVELKLSTQMLSSVAYLLSDRRQLSFAVIATGDDDEKDCKHTRFDMNVNIKYVVNPESNPSTTPTQQTAAP